MLRRRCVAVHLGRHRTVMGQNRDCEASSQYPSRTASVKREDSDGQNSGNDDGLLGGPLVVLISLSARFASVNVSA